MDFIWEWVGLVTITVWISLSAFIWAMQSGQFADQDRARYLPLVDNYSPVETDVRSKLPKEVYVLSTVGVLTVVAMLCCMLIAMNH